MIRVMWQIGEFLLDVCLKLFCNDRACPLNPLFNVYYIFIDVDNYANIL
jgi:hypothetical protein